MTLTQADQAHFAEILALNEESVHFLSPLSAQRLDQLHQQAAYHKLVLEGGRVAAFLLAFAPGSGNVPTRGVNPQPGQAELHVLSEPLRPAE